jgi:hypothetical protein
MKKIALASAAMGGVALFAFGASGTFASLSDSNTQNLTARAGTLALGIDRPATMPTAAGNLAPGDSVVVPFYAKNTGSGVTGKVGVALDNRVNNENGCSSVSERTAENGACDTPGDLGEFSQAATYEVALSGASEANCITAGASSVGTYHRFTLTDGLAPAQSPITLTSGQGQCVVLKITLPKESAGNAVQGDSLSFDAVVTLQQVI